MYPVLITQRTMPEVRVEEARRFMEDSLKAVGALEKEAQAHAALLLHADLTGHFSHGINRLGMMKTFLSYYFAVTIIKNH